MKKLFSLIGMVVPLVVLSQLPPTPKTTIYTRGLLTNTTAAAARSYLGVISGGSATNAITQLNGITNPIVSYVVGSAGNDAALSDNGDNVLTLDLPTASATKRGLLSTSDWTSFNSSLKGNPGSTTELIASSNGVSTLIATNWLYDTSLNQIKTPIEKGLHLTGAGSTPGFLFMKSDSFNGVRDDMLIVGLNQHPTNTATTYKRVNTSDPWWRLDWEANLKTGAGYIQSEHNLDWGTNDANVDKRLMQMFVIQTNKQVTTWFAADQFNIMLDEYPYVSQAQVSIASNMMTVGHGVLDTNTTLHVSSRQRAINQQILLESDTTNRHTGIIGYNLPLGSALNNDYAWMLFGGMNNYVSSQTNETGFYLGASVPDFAIRWSPSNLNSGGGVTKFSVTSNGVATIASDLIISSPTAAEGSVFSVSSGIGQFVSQIANASIQDLAFSKITAGATTATLTNNGAWINQKPPQDIVSWSGNNVSQNIDMAGAPVQWMIPTNNTTWSFVNVPTSTNRAVRVELHIYNPSTYTGTFSYTGLVWVSKITPTITTNGWTKFLFDWNGTNVLGTLVDGGSTNALTADYGGTGTSNGDINANNLVVTNSAWFQNTSLAYAGGTNITIDLANSTKSVYYLTLTNTAFFTTPSNVPASATTNRTLYVFLKQDATGARSVTWTNSTFKFPGGTVPTITTNANAVDLITLTLSPFTAGQVYAVATQDIK